MGVIWFGIIWSWGVAIWTWVWFPTLGLWSQACDIGVIYGSWSIGVYSMVVLIENWW
jgi:hypothetical protein